MSTRTENKPAAPQGLSLSTLVIASLSSIAAALFIHKFWTGGAILGAGITPIIVAVVGESLKKPQRALAARRELRSTGGPADRTARQPAAPAGEPPREDRFGIWGDEDQQPRFRKLRGRPLKLAIATGLAAFAIGAILLTGTELVFGGGGGSGGDRLTLVPGKQQKSDDEQQTETTTQPSEETQTVPEEQLTTPQTTPPETVPETTPEGAVPPPQTVPPATTPPPPTTPPATVPPSQ